MGSSKEANQLKKLLIERFEAARSKNPSYSLRAFAKALKIDHSTLSRVLTGKREVSESIARKIASKLEIFLDADELPTDPSVRELTLEEHMQISSWVAAAIQEMTRTKGFQSNASWIAKKLGIPQKRAEITIDTLFRLGFLKRLQNGKWIDQVDHWYSDNFENFSESKKSNAISLKELNKVAEWSYENLAENFHSFSRITVAGSPDQIEKAKKLISRFRKDLMQIFGNRRKDPEQVYVAKIDLFPLLKDQDSNE